MYGSPPVKATVLGSWWSTKRRKRWVSYSGSLLSDWRVKRTSLHITNKNGRGCQMRAEVKLTGWNDSEENKQELLWGSDWAKLDGLDADLLSHSRHLTSIFCPSSKWLSNWIAIPLPECLEYGYVQWLLNWIDEWVDNSMHGWVLVGF